MKRILTTLSQKWPEYLLEILVLIIGIYGAFAVDNWNTNRLERIEGNEIIRNIEGDIEKTIIEFQKLNTLRNYIIKGTNEMLAIRKFDELESRRLDSLIALTFYRPTFNNKLGSINLLFTSGKINLIKNDSIRDLLIGLPGEIDDLIEEEVYSNELFHDQYVPIVFKYFVFEDISLQEFGSTLLGNKTREKFKTTALKESDYKNLLQNQEFRNQISFRRNQMDLTNNEALFLIARLNLISKLIKKELSK